MRRHTRGALHARLKRLEDRPGPLKFRFLLDDGSTVDLSIDIVLAVICRRQLEDRWEPVVGRIVAPAEEPAGLLVGVAAAMARWRGSGLPYEDWLSQQEAT